ncbi:MAG TPA: nucleotidyltransferase [Thermotogae bacterium]|nr:nucleotidyltransferase [Thermotogota bacterium]
MKDVETIKSILEQHKDEIRKKYGVRIIGIFGSYARGDQSRSSDIDILIEIEKPVGLKFYELWDELENLLGCEVDLVRRKLLREELREDILRRL